VELFSSVAPKCCDKAAGCDGLDTVHGETLLCSNNLFVKAGKVKKWITRSVEAYDSLSARTAVLVRRNVIVIAIRTKGERDRRRPMTAE